MQTMQRTEQKIDKKIETILQLNGQTTSTLM